MKKNILKYCTVFATFLLAYACSKKDGVTNQPYQTYGISSTQGFIKINYASAYFANPTVLLKINDQVVSSLITGRTPFPGGGYNTNGSSFALYLSVPQGTNTLSIVRPKVGTGLDSIVLYTATFNIPDTMPYTLHITDTLVNATSNNTKQVLIKNIINYVDTGSCRFRFVNLIPNVTAVDLYLNGILMKSNISYLQATDTFTVTTGFRAPSYATFPTPTWAVRAAGSAATSPVIASYAATTTLQSQAVITIFSMGYSGLTGTRLPYLCFTLDKNQ